MKRIVTHMLVAAGLAIGAVGAAQAHSDLHIGVSLGAPAYVAPAPVYVRPAPVYGRPYYRHDEPRWHGNYGHDNGRWNRAGWHDNGNHNGWGRRG
ncbi:MULTISPECIES: PXPV repeat protein [unclassified Caballeronia]|jgi:hypothetical protein|uniref:PXPV repeat protein n=1 Tax=unclassified Caballeronia TaxID=2646786 RepID=UPI0028554C41|nr:MULTISPECIES: PXPV repeat protein [unclassified Caballeronia]MDR5770308.1 PXPV repeat protein [Caballeronia sp. LZ002]MDR5845745.1 PXPV repeat protein [Caballeronia sp. LZ003]